MVLPIYENEDAYTTIDGELVGETDASDAQTAAVSGPGDAADATAVMDQMVLPGSGMFGDAAPDFVLVRRLKDGYVLTMQRPVRAACMRRRHGATGIPADTTDPTGAPAGSDGAERPPAASAVAIAGDGATAGAPDGAVTGGFASRCLTRATFAFVAPSEATWQSVFRRVVDADGRATLVTLRGLAAVGVAADGTAGLGLAAGARARGGGGWRRGVKPRRGAPWRCGGRAGESTGDAAGTAADAADGAAAAAAVAPRAAGPPGVRVVFVGDDASDDMTIAAAVDGASGAAVSVGGELAVALEAMRGHAVAALLVAAAAHMLLARARASGSTRCALVGGDAVAESQCCRPSGDPSGAAPAARGASGDRRGCACGYGGGRCGRRGAGDASVSRARPCGPRRDGGDDDGAAGGTWEGPSCGMPWDRQLWRGGGGGWGAARDALDGAVWGPRWRSPHGGGHRWRRRWWGWAADGGDGDAAAPCGGGSGGGWVSSDDGPWGAARHGRGRHSRDGRSRLGCDGECGRGRWVGARRGADGRP